MYGEQDTFLIYTLLKNGKSRQKISQFGDGTSLTQMTYVGNVAWAHIIAKDKLSSNPLPISGEVYFITDDTDLYNVFQTIEPYAKTRNLQISKRKLPYWIVYGIVYVMEFVMTIVNQVHEVSGSVPASGGVTYLCTTFTFNRTKASLKLNYQPIFNPAESLDRSIQYYSSCDLQ